MKRNLFMSFVFGIALFAAMTPAAVSASSTADASYSLEIISVTVDGLSLSPVGQTNIYAYGNTSVSGLSATSSSDTNPASVSLMSSAGPLGGSSVTSQAQYVLPLSPGTRVSGAASSNAADAGYSDAYAYSSINYSYAISGSGSLTIRALFNITANVSGTIAEDSFHALSSVLLWAESGDSTSYSYDEKTRELWTSLSSGAGSESLSRTGYLTLVYDYYEPGTGTVTFGISGDADVSTGTPGPVPVPAAVWLFGSGLLGLIGMRRRTAP